MTFRRLPSGLYVPRRALGGGPPGRMPVPPDAGSSNNPADQAKGFIPSSATNAAQDAFRQAGLDPQWVPTDPSQIGPWAKEQARVFGSKEVQNGIAAGKDLYSRGKSQAPNISDPLGENDSERWAERYVSKNGFPTDGPSALRMARAYVVANANKIGLPPEFIAAADLIEHFPDTTEDAVHWAVELGTAFLATFGVPIVDPTDTSSFIEASARAAVTEMAPGVPFGLFEATWAALSDGQLTAPEAEGIIVGAAGYVGAIVGQAFGIPAPIGAVISQVVVGAIVSALVDAFGWGETDADKLHAAQESAKAAAAAASAQCTAVAVALWLEYQHYWDAITKDINRTIHDNQSWLFPGGSCTLTNGIRLYGTTSLDVVHDGNGNPVLLDPRKAVPPGGTPEYRRYPYPVTRVCNDPTGCPYRATDLGRLIARDRYALSPAELDQVPGISLTGAGCDAESVLAFWNARRYATPMQVIYALKGEPMKWVEPVSGPSARNVSTWNQSVHSDLDYLTKVVGYVGTYGAAATQVGDCNVSAWAQMMFMSLEQAAAGAALVQRDLARTVSAAATAYGIQYHLDQAAGVQFQAATDAQKRAAVRQVAANVARLRHDLTESAKRGRHLADFLNYGLLTAGGAALLGYGLARRR